MAKGSQTSKSVQEIPDAQLVCYICGKNDRQEDMRFDRTKRTKTGKVIRIAMHNSCRREQRKKQEQKKAMSIEMNCEDVPTPAPTPGEQKTLFKRLISD